MSSTAFTGTITGTKVNTETVTDINQYNKTYTNGPCFRTDSNDTTLIGIDQKVLEMIGREGSGVCYAPGGKKGVANNVYEFVKTLDYDFNANVEWYYACSWNSFTYDINAAGMRAYSDLAQGFMSYGTNMFKQMSGTGLSEFLLEPDSEKLATSDSIRKLGFTGGYTTDKAGTVSLPELSKLEGLIFSFGMNEDSNLFAQNVLGGSYGAGFSVNNFSDYKREFNNYNAITKGYLYVGVAPPYFKIGSEYKQYAEIWQPYTVAYNDSTWGTVKNSDVLNLVNNSDSHFMSFAKAASGKYDDECKPNYVRKRINGKVYVEGKKNKKGEFVITRPITGGSLSDTTSTITYDIGNGHVWDHTYIFSGSALQNLMKRANQNLPEEYRKLKQATEYFALPVCMRAEDSTSSKNIYATCGNYVLWGIIKA